MMKHKRKRLQIFCSGYNQKINIRCRETQNKKIDTKRRKQKETNALKNELKRDNEKQKVTIVNLHNKNNELIVAAKKKEFV
mmetsp:Transcript_36109/g.41495  ORF Transcript_36109/g.41495 Transcript_36109/m.41495 type:complete len:81 (-) Transcript_36109:115-357(-)